MAHFFLVSTSLRNLVGAHLTYTIQQSNVFEILTSFFKESSELINRLVMHQPLTHINPQMTSNQALGLIRYYDQMKQSSAPVVQSEIYSNPPESPPPVSTVTPPNEHSPNLVPSQQRTASRQSDENYYVEIV